MSKLMFVFAMFVPSLTTACLSEAPESEAETAEEAARLGKIEIINDKLTSCDKDGGSDCFAALAGQAKNCSNTTGAEQMALNCWCTHCDNGNFCESYDGHQTHDEKCTLKPKTALEKLEETFVDQPR